MIIILTQKEYSNTIFLIVCKNVTLDNSTDKLKALVKLLENS